ncbi:MAG: DNA pilot protein [Microvirus sp.]|nr:MAG: DNA pilot protein [Microvirus sp.]
MGVFSSALKAATGGALDWAKESIMANSANAKAKRQANWAWQRTMDADNTKYQRTMADMKEAGLNPILGMSEAGATSPGQATAATTHQANSTGNGFLASANQVQQMVNQQKLADAQTGKLHADTLKQIQEAGLLGKYGEKKAKAEIDRIISDTSASKQMQQQKRFSAAIGGMAGQAAEALERRTKKIAMRKHTNSAKKGSAWNNIFTFKANSY